MPIHSFVQEEGSAGEWNWLEDEHILLGLVGRMLTQNGTSCVADRSTLLQLKDNIFGLRFCWRHVVQSESENLIMSGDVGLQHGDSGIKRGSVDS